MLPEVHGSKSFHLLHLSLQVSLCVDRRSFGTPTMYVNEMSVVDGWKINTVYVGCDRNAELPYLSSPVIV